MSLPISSLLNAASVASPSRLQTLSQTQKGAGGFGSALTEAIQGVDQTQKQAESSIQDFLQGKGELHNVALATQRAEMTFDLGLQIRNKVVSAYQEIMKMQL
jgi:flagellar hook-basal body complex protein FliE